MNLSGSGMVAITRDSLATLRSALMRDTGYAAFGYLQEAGYAGGAALFEAFRGWLDARGAGAPEALSVGDFQSLATDFFRECGWGSLVVGDLHDTVATLDSADWGEATPGAGFEHPACHLSSGMFADFFGRDGWCSAGCDGSGVSLVGRLALPIPARKHRGASGTSTMDMASGVSYEEALETVDSSQ